MHLSRVETVQGYLDLEDFVVCFVKQRLILVGRYVGIFLPTWKIF